MVEGLKGGMIPQRASEGRAPAERAPVEAASAQRPASVAAAGAGRSAARAEAREALGMKGLVKDLARKPPVDEARVAELRAAISGGRYPIDAERIADAMLRSERG